MKKILVAIDDSGPSLEAVDYVGRQFSGMRDLQITLYHVLLGTPPEFWDDGHLLTEEERAARKVVVEKWLANQKVRLESLFHSAIERLITHGISRSQIETKFTLESIDVVAQCILAEAKAGGYQTLVIGRCGRSKVQHFFLGSIANRIINSGAEMAICVVK